MLIMIDDIAVFSMVYGASLMLILFIVGIRMTHKAWSFMDYFRTFAILTRFKHCKTMRKRSYLMVALRHSDGIMIASKSKTAIAKHVGISYYTILRHTNDNGPYRREAFIVWFDVEHVMTR